MDRSDDPHPSSSCSNYSFVSQDHLHSSHARSGGHDTSSYAPNSSSNSSIRRRRRRTSPHDQQILEEEYRKCDRPDKARRKEITKLVQMGEKEVQIWFCNKRQAARRRALPLLPHEMIPRSSQHASSSPSASPPTTAPHLYHHHHLARAPTTPSQSTSLPPSSTPVPASTPSSAAHHRLQSVLDTSPPLHSHIPTSSPLPHPRRTTTMSSTAPTLLKRSSSSLRLSTSLDGKAILLETTLTSSPPLPARLPHSQSFTSSPPPPAPTPLRKRRSFPVDSKLFEFCADNASALLSPTRTPPQPPEATQALRLIRNRSFTRRAVDAKGVARTPVLKRSQTDGALLSTAKKRKHREGGDSDKENRAPGEGAGIMSPPTTQPPKRRALGDSKGQPALKRSHTEGWKEKKVDEVELFMSGGKMSKEERRRAEIECVENLLSLRGGSWR